MDSNRQARRFAAAFSALFLIGSLFAAREAIAYKGTWRVALIEVTYTDTASIYTTAQLTAAAGEIHNYYSDISYGQTHVIVVPFKISLPATKETYWASDGTPLTTTPRLIDVVAQQAVVGTFSFAGINAISVLNTFCPSKADFTNGETTVPNTGETTNFGRSMDFECANPPPGPSGVSWGGWSHEMGHQLELADNIDIWNWGKGGHPSEYSSGYDEMDSCYPCDTSAYSKLGKPVMNGSEKVFSGWMPAANAATLAGPATGTTVVLTPIEQNFTKSPATQALKVVPLAGGGYYLVEARQRLLGDLLQNHGGVLRGIYDTGVHIDWIEEAGNPPMTPIDPCDHGIGPACVHSHSDPRYSTDCVGTLFPSYCWPYNLWHVGDSLVDSARGVTITNEGAVGDGFTVSATLSVAPGAPNMFIIPWLTPPMNTYETEDIWVDSSCNGYQADVGNKGLRYGVRADGTVIGNGDDPCANHENRIYATVHNIGNADATSIVVHFKVTNPLGVGVSGSWTQVGKVTIPTLAAGASKTIFVLWTPTVALTAAQIAAGRFKYHSCVQVIIDPVAGELITDDNQAQENFNDFDAVQGTTGAYPIVSGNFNVNISALGGNDANQPVWLDVVSGLPAGWTYEVNGGVDEFQLGSPPTVTVPVKITVPAGTPVGESYHLAARATYLATLTNDAIPTNLHQRGTHIGLTQAGGVTLGVQTVLPSRLTEAISLDGSGNIVATGVLSPAAAGAGAVIAVDYEDPGGQTFTRLATADSTGKYTCRLGPWIGNATTWNVRALWQGDRQYTSALSQQHPIVVLQANTTTPGSPHTEPCP